MPASTGRPRVRLRILLFLGSAFVILVSFYFLSEVSKTLNQLTVVEAERDQWQRPADILGSLGIRSGSTVVDLGSGAGYFALKLADMVGPRGEVVAVDLRRLSLFFLRLRALLKNRHNIRIIVGTADDPHLPASSADAVLIANTYHEFANPSAMLLHTWNGLRPGGRLVIVDRGPRPGEDAHGHEAAPNVVETAVRQSGFDILGRNDRFIDRAGDEPWWLLVARKP